MERRRSSSFKGPPPDVEQMLESFRKCHLEDGVIATSQYLAAVNELVKLFSQLGKGLNFVIDDVEEALKGLEFRRVAGCMDHYNYLHTLLEFEDNTGLGDKQQAGDCLLTGTASFLLLHQVVTFILAFLHKLKECLDNDVQFKAPVRIKVYEVTLGKRHTALKQNAHKVALLKSPGRHEMMARLSSRGLGDPSRTITELLETAEPVEKQVENLLKRFKVIQ